MRSWVFLIYKVPNEPTSGRVFVWRKLKKLGAILLHDAVWILPARSHTREQLRWLAAEISELSGEASVWESRAALGTDEERLVAQFEEAVDGPYAEILEALKEEDPDLGGLSRRYQQIVERDFFRSELGQDVREALVTARRKRR